MQIIVLGMHRSGTSLTTRLINMMGAYFGPEGSSLGFDIDNPKGYWERMETMRLNTAILKLHNVNWADVAGWPLPHRPCKLPPALWRDMKRLVMDMDAFRPWLLKDPRLCLTLPYWQPMLETPVYVILHRDPVEIALSMETRKNFPMPIARGVALWEFYCVALLNATQGQNRIFANHANFVQDPVDATARLYDNLQSAGVRGLRLPHKCEITAFIDPRLYRSKRAGRNTPDYQLSESQRDLVGMMSNQGDSRRILSVTEPSMKILEKAAFPADGKSFLRSIFTVIYKNKLST